MLRKIGFGISVLIGLALGLTAAYWAVRLTFKANFSVARSEVERTLSLVDERLQRMADLSMQTEKTLTGLGQRPPAAFAKVQAERSRLNGADTLETKLKYSESLEASLLQAKQSLEDARTASSAVAKSFYAQEAGRQWESETSWLSKEQAEFRETINAYNRVVTKWPGSWFAQGYTLRHMAYETSVKVRDRGWAKTKNLAAKAAWQAKRLWAKIRKKEQPAAPAEIAPAEPPAPPTPLYVALAVPGFENKAAWPEEFKDEVQYRKDMPDMTVEHLEAGKLHTEAEQMPGMMELYRESKRTGRTINRVVTAKEKTEE